MDLVSFLLVRLIYLIVVLYQKNTSQKKRTILGISKIRSNAFSIAHKYIFSNTNFGPNKDLLNKEFKIRLITKKIADKMTKEISNGTILYRRNFIICDIKL